MRPATCVCFSNLSWFALQISRLRSYCRKTARRSFSPRFSVHPATLNEKLCVGSQKMIPPFYAFDIVYYPAKFEEDRTMRAGCRCEDVVYVFFCHAQIRSAGRSRCTLFEQSLRIDLWIIFYAVSSIFFQKDVCFHVHYTVLIFFIFVARSRHNVRENAVKNCEKFVGTTSNK